MNFISNTTETAKNEKSFIRRNSVVSIDFDLLIWGYFNVRSYTETFLFLTEQGYVKPRPNLLPSQSQQTQFTQ